MFKPSTLIPSPWVIKIINIDQLSGAASFGCAVQVWFDCMVVWFDCVGVWFNCMVVWFDCMVVLV